MPINDHHNFPAPTSTKLTTYLRTSLPWQIIRFFIINIQMTLMILKSHGRKIQSNPKKNKKD